jgi:hypothetical protein
MAVERHVGHRARIVRTTDRALAMTPWPPIDDGGGPPDPTPWKSGTYGYYYDTYGPLLGGNPALLQVAMAFWDLDGDSWFLRMNHLGVLTPDTGTALPEYYGDTMVGIYAHCNDGTWHPHFVGDFYNLTYSPGPAPGNVVIPKDPDDDVYADRGGRAGNDIVFTQSPQAARIFLLPEGGYTAVGTYDPDTDSYTTDGWNAEHWVRPDQDGIISPIHAAFTTWGSAQHAPSGALLYIDDSYRPVLA